MKYCNQLTNIPKNKEETWEFGKFVCNITNKICIAAYSPMSTGGYAVYNDNQAQDCPAYDVSNSIVKIIQEDKLLREKSQIETKLKTLKNRKS